MSSWVHLASLAFDTTEAIQFIDITDEVAKFVSRVGTAFGVVTIFSRHTTAAVRIQAREPRLMEEFRSFLEEMAPARHSYRHNNFNMRVIHMQDDERPNGHAHCAQFMLGASERVPVAEGELQLGALQRIFFIELDGPRIGRSVIVQMLGAPTAPATEHPPAA